jgi:outer membrane protein assembly factor BamB
MIAVQARQHKGSSSGWMILVIAAVLFVLFAGLGGYFIVRKYFDDYSPIDNFSDGSGNEGLKEDAPFSWPGYLGPQRDGTSTEKGLLKKWPDDGPPVAWEKKLGGGYSSMAMAKGRLVTMYYETGNEVVICLNADNGKPIWRRSNKASYKDQDSRFTQGPRSTPTIDDDRVYTVGATGIFTCWQLKDGKQLWQHDLNDEYDAEQLKWGTAFSPLIYKDLVITNPGGDKGSIVAFNKKSGKEAWKARDDKASYCSPMLVTAEGIDQVVIFNHKDLVSVSADDGHELWDLAWKTDYDLNVPVPLWIEKHLFVSTGYGTGCAKLKIGKKKNGDLDVETIFKNTDLCNHFSNSVYYKGYMYGFDRSDGPLVCMDFETGDVKWTQKGLGRGQLLVADDHIIIQTEGSEKDKKGIEARLILLEPTPDEYRAVSSFVFSHQSKCWAAPALANGKLYVRDNEKLVCYDLHR